jgi:oligosaccharide reducing-end xylanase
VATWEGFRPAAITYTFDDSAPKQFTVALPMFNEAGFKMTFFSCTGVMFAGWDTLSAAAAAGHEVTSHTVNHRSLGSLADDQQILELANSQTAIRSKVPGAECLTIAYPNCNPSKQTLTEQYYIAARICSQQIISPNPGNFYQLSSIICGVNGMVKTSQDFQTQFGNALSAGGWACFLIHGIDSDGGWSSTDSAAIQGSLDFLKDNQDLYWVDTFANVVRYIKERNDVTLTEVTSSSDAVVVSLTDSLDNAIYNVAITVRRPLPSGWNWASATQNGVALKSKIVDENSTRYIVFNAVPDAGDVTIAAEEQPTWLATYPVQPNGWAEAQDWMGWVYPFDDGFAWSDKIGWIYVPESSFSETGGWVYDLQ